jgi:diguanylate cyclase (GGDEF)-like protein
VLVLLAGAVFAAAQERRLRTERRGRHDALVAQLEQLHGGSTLGRLLDANRPGDVEQELIRSRRHGHAASVLLVRPDELDDIGLRHGEDGVREVLRAIAQTIGAITRGTDTGASEPAHDFLILLPETAAPGARVAAERVRLAVAAQRLVFGPGDPLDLSVSIGSASFPDDAADSTELIERARAALERAIELGGNRTVLHTAPPTAPPRWGMTRAIAPGAPTL